MIPEGQYVARFWNPMREVCTYWKDGFDYSVTKIDIKPPPSEVPECRGDRWESGGPGIILTNFQKFPMLLKLRLKNFTLSKSSLAGLHGFSSPPSNPTSNPPSNPPSGPPSNLPSNHPSKLRELHLLACDVLSPQVFTALRCLPCLERLNLFCSRVSDKSLRAISKLSLTSLLLRDILGVRDSSIYALRGMKRLRELDLSGNSCLSKAGLRALQGFPELAALYLQDWTSEIPVAGLRAIKGLTALDLCHEAQGFVGNDYLWEMRHMPLKSLVVDGGAQFCDAGIECLRGMPLTALYLGCTQYLSEETVRGLKSILVTEYTELEFCSNPHRF